MSPATGPMSPARAGEEPAKIPETVEGLAGSAPESEAEVRRLRRELTRRPDRSSARAAPSEVVFRLIK